MVQKALRVMMVEVGDGIEIIKKKSELHRHIERVVNKIGQICTHKCSKFPPVEVSDMPHG